MWAPGVYRGQKESEGTEVPRDLVTLQSQSRSLGKKGLKEVQVYSIECTHLPLPQPNVNTNINHKGLQRTANEYAAELRIYKEDLISKNTI